MSSPILSTKKLTDKQKRACSSTDIILTDYDAISVDLINFNSPKNVKNAIFSSQNAVKSVLKHQKSLFSGQIENCFCVGSKTATLLTENDQNVVKMAANASELGDFIKKTYKNEDFYFFCGKHRRDELPQSFLHSENQLFELETYKIEPNEMHFDQKWDKILFFSPSGVQSFTAKNNIGDALAICIGSTTASEAKKHTELIFVSQEQTVESVLEYAIKLKKVK